MQDTTSYFALSTQNTTCHLNLILPVLVVRALACGVSVGQCPAAQETHTLLSQRRTPPAIPTVLVVQCPAAALPRRPTLTPQEFSADQHKPTTAHYEPEFAPGIGQECRHAAPNTGPGPVCRARPAMCGWPPAARARTDSTGIRLLSPDKHRPPAGRPPSGTQPDVASPTPATRPIHKTGSRAAGAGRLNTSIGPLSAGIRRVTGPTLARAQARGPPPTRPSRRESESTGVRVDGSRSRRDCLGPEAGRPGSCCACPLTARAGGQSSRPPSTRNLLRLRDSEVAVLHDPELAQTP